MNFRNNYNYHSEIYYERNESGVTTYFVKGLSYLCFVTERTRLSMIHLFSSSELHLSSKQ